MSGSALRSRPFVPHLDGAIAGCAVHAVGEHVHVDGTHGARVTVLQQAVGVRVRVRVRVRDRVIG